MPQTLVWHEGAVGLVATHITWSCTSTWSCICNRHWRPDSSIVLELRCETPTLAPPPSPLYAPRYWLISLLVLFDHLCLWLPLFPEGLSLTSRLSSSVYLDVRTNSWSTAFLCNFSWICLHPPVFLCVGEKWGGGGRVTETFLLADESR